MQGYSRVPLVYVWLSWDFSLTSVSIGVVLVLCDSCRSLKNEELEFSSLISPG